MRIYILTLRATYGLAGNWVTLCLVAIGLIFFLHQSVSNDSEQELFYLYPVYHPLVHFALIEIE